MPLNNKSVEPTMAQKAIYSVPVFGWLLKDAVNGGASALLWFIFNVVAIWLIAILNFGYPAIIIPAMFVVLLLLTTGK